MYQTINRTLAASVSLASVRLNGAVQTVAARCFALARRLGTRRAATFALAAAVLSTVADPALAQTAGGNGDITTFLTNIVNLITGTAGKSIAVIGLVIVGIGMLAGQLSMRTAGSVVLGIMIIFSAAWIVGQVIGSSS